MIPAVNGEQKLKEASLKVPSDGWICVTSRDNKAQVEVLETRLKKWKRFENLTLKVVSEDHMTATRETAFLTVTKVVDGRMASRAVNPGAYTLEVSERGIQIIAADDEGIANGLTSLYWNIREGEGEIAQGIIHDAPEYLHRGFLVDVSRHFFDVDTVKSMIEQATLRKMNRLHWHLSDDQGFRIESKRFPKLNEIGSWRVEMDGSTYGGYFTQEEIRDIVVFAKVRGMEIIPEIDMPGHVTAMLMSYPQYACSDEPVEPPMIGGIHERIFCAGKDETLEFIKALLDEVMELFPYPCFHIGGDEAPKGEWKKCPHCQKRIQVKGLENEEELQGWFTNEILRHLKEKGRTGICWNESLMSGTLEENALIQYWEIAGEYEKDPFADTRKFIFSGTGECYLDSVPAMLPLRTVWHQKPHYFDGSPIPRDQVIGFEGNLWAEDIPHKKRLEEMAFPRLLALADMAWGNEDSYEDFLLRCQRQNDFMDEDDIAHFSMQEADPEAEQQIEGVLVKWGPMITAMIQYGETRYLDVVTNIVQTRMKPYLTPEQMESLMERLKNYRNS